MRLICLIMMLCSTLLLNGCGEEKAKCSFCHKSDEVSKLVNGEHPSCTAERERKEREARMAQLAENKLKETIPEIIVDKYMFFNNATGDPTTVRLDFRTKVRKQGRAFVFIYKNGDVVQGKIINLTDK